MPSRVWTRAVLWGGIHQIWFGVDRVSGGVDGGLVVLGNILAPPCWGMDGPNVGCVRASSACARPTLGFRVRPYSASTKHEIDRCSPLFDQVRTISCLVRQGGI